jgi:hypothetical protein
VHPRIVRYCDNEAAVYFEERTIDKGISRHVEPYVLHGHDGPLSREGRAKRGFHRGFFV